MINVLIILMESITTWLCLHIVFGKKIEKKWMQLSFFGVYIVLSVLCSYKMLNKFFLVFIVVWAIIWSRKMFGENLKHSIIKSLIGIIMLGIVEMFVMSLFYQYVKQLRDYKKICVALCGICLLVVIIIYSILKNKEKIFKSVFINKVIIFFTLFVFAFLVCIKIEFENQRRVNVIYLFFFVVLLFAFVYMFKEQKAIYELEQKNLKLQLHNLYGQAYEELLKIVRLRQHDYKNQLTAISSMYNSAGSLEELINMQRKYLDILESESKYDKILTRCNNPIIAGYIYNQCMKYVKENIEIEYDINISTSEVDIKTKEIIEILGVLISNAVEAYNSKKEDEMIVKILIQEDNYKFTIVVENRGDYIPYSEIEKLFCLGYSTKGKDRGMGLYSIKNIVKKFSGTISVDNTIKNNENWVKFCVVI